MAETALTLDDVNRRQRRLLGRTAMQEELGLSAPGAQRRLVNSGLTEQDIASLVSGNPNLSYEYLTQQAKKGPVAGRVSAARRADITAGRGKERLDEAAELAQTRGLDSIAAMEGNFGQSLAALGGGPLDMNSPAVQAILARQIAARGESQQSMMNMIEQNRVLGHNALEANADANVIPLLTDIGDTVAALEAMREQEKNLMEASVGQAFGILGPVGGAVGGALTGGSTGMASGYSSGMDTLSLVIKALTMGGGGGLTQMPNGGTGFTPDPYSPYNTYSVFG